MVVWHQGIETTEQNPRLCRQLSDTLFGELVGELISAAAIRAWQGPFGNIVSGNVVGTWRRNGPVGKVSMGNMSEL